VSVPVATITTDFIPSSASFGSACTSSTRWSRLNIDFYKFLYRISEGCHIIHWCIYCLHSSTAASSWWCDGDVHLTLLFSEQNHHHRERRRSPESWNEWPINCYIGPRRAWVTLMYRDSLFIIYREGHLHLRKQIALHVLGNTALINSIFILFHEHE